MVVLLLAWSDRMDRAHKPSWIGWRAGLALIGRTMFQMLKTLPNHPTSLLSNLPQHANLRTYERTNHSYPPWFRSTYRFEAWRPDKKPIWRLPMKDVVLVHTEDIAFTPCLTFFFLAASTGRNYLAFLLALLWGIIPKFDLGRQIQHCERSSPCLTTIWCHLGQGGFFMAWDQEGDQSVGVKQGER